MVNSFVRVRAVEKSFSLKYNNINIYFVFLKVFLIYIIFGSVCTNVCTTAIEMDKLYLSHKRMYSLLWL